MNTNTANTNTNTNTANTNTNTIDIAVNDPVTLNNISNITNMVCESNIQPMENTVVVIEKKKRGRKKTIKPDVDVAVASSSSDNTVVATTEKKIRKRRSKKNIAMENALAKGLVGDNGNTNSIESTNVKGDIVTGVKVRKRRVCKSKNKNDDIHTDSNVIIDSNNQETNPPEEKVAKKRGRKPKGGKIITQKLEDNNNNNEIPNIILHLKCSLNDIKNKNSDNVNNVDDEKERNEIQSYNNSSQLKGSDIYIKGAHTSNSNSSKEIQNSPCNIEPIPAYNDSLSHLFKVYNPSVNSSESTDSETNVNCHKAAPLASFPSANATSFNNNTHSLPNYSSNEIINQKTGFFNSVYSPDVNLYNTEYDDGDDGDSVMGTCKNEKEIWRKINQLKVSFHKSDICKNTGGTQRSACFWCTCEFDSPAIYIPKTLTKDVYNVYGCFCSPECSAAFLMNENIDTSTKFERYHLLNLLYGKIYKYEKSIKVAPNPFYLLNKFYGNLTIQEYRKLFQSEQMIYIVNKPLTHILPELYEDNNDFLLNNKIIPTNSVNIKKNKPLKSNIINNAFGITVGN
jgi:hypothetical protein